MAPVTHRSLAIILAVALALGAGFGWGLGASESAGPLAAANPPSAVKAGLPVSSDSFAQIVEAVGPAVININTVTRGLAGRIPIEEFFGEEFMRRFFGDLPEREFRQRGLGSG
jgi:serine protease Do